MGNVREGVLDVENDRRPWDGVRMDGIMIPGGRIRLMGGLNRERERGLPQSCVEGCVIGGLFPGDGVSWP